MVREVTIYNWKGTPARERHYRNVIKQLEDSDFTRTHYQINNDDNTIKFWSYSMNEWRGLTEELNKPY